MASSEGKHRRAVVELGYLHDATRGAPTGRTSTGMVSDRLQRGMQPRRRTVPRARLLRRGLDVVVVDDVDRCLLRAGAGAVDADVLGDQVRVDVGADALVGCDQPPGPVGPDLRVRLV